jgi:hypothetical protein
MFEGTSARTLTFPLAAPAESAAKDGTKKLLPQRRGDTQRNAEKAKIWLAKI